MNAIAEILTAPAPFSLKATVLCHGWHECAPMSWCEGGRCFQIIDRVGDRACRVSVVQTDRDTGNGTAALRVQIEGETVSDKDLARIMHDVRVVLGLDRDLSEFYALCTANPALRLVPQLGTGRGLRSASMTENIIKALMCTNVNWTQAVKMINRLGQLGPPLRHFANLNAWPTPREILRAGERYLVEVCRVGYRAGSILRFCEDVCAGRFATERLDAMAADPTVSSDDILDTLRGIRGIGPSSAHYLLSFLGRHDRLSIDSATIAHVARTHFRGKRPTHKQIEAVYAHYGRWKNLAWWYEHWLSWDTARTIVREAGLDVEPAAPTQTRSRGAARPRPGSTRRLIKRAS